MELKEFKVSQGSSFWDWDHHRVLRGNWIPKYFGFFEENDVQYLIVAETPVIKWGEKTFQLEAVDSLSIKGMESLAAPGTYLKVHKVFR